MPKINPLEASFKLIAVSGIFTMWVNLTIEAVKFSWHIISTSPGEENYKPLVKLVCQRCEEIFRRRREEARDYWFSIVRILRIKKK